MLVVATVAASPAPQAGLTGLPAGRLRAASMWSVTQANAQVAAVVAFTAPFARRNRPREQRQAQVRRSSRRASRAGCGPARPRGLRDSKRPNSSS